MYLYYNVSQNSGGYINLRTYFKKFKRNLKSNHVKIIKLNIIYAQVLFNWTFESGCFQTPILHKCVDVFEKCVMYLR